MAKYIIETNMTDDSFGAFIPAPGCRNVGIDEMKGYHYWPGDVFYVFMKICNHVLPKTLTYCSGYEDAYITATLSDDEHWLRFKRISDEEAKTGGLKEFDSFKWIVQLQKDLKQNKNYKNYNK